MKLVFVYTLLLLMVVLQSFSPIVSATETHQVDAVHLQTEHSHQNDTSLLLSENDEHDIKDCHHCGHCSGIHLSWLSVKEPATQNFTPASKLSFQLASAISTFIEPALRPPIV